MPVTIEEIDKLISELRIIKRDFETARAVTIMTERGASSALTLRERNLISDSLRVMVAAHESLKLITKPVPVIMPLLPDEPTCEARQQSDQMRCVRCNIIWDTNDHDPPVCPKRAKG